MGFYSFVVWAPEEIPLPEAMTLLERGSNTFNVVLKDVDAFTAKLEAGGCRIVQKSKLDTFDRVDPNEELVLSTGEARQLSGQGDEPPTLS